MSTNEGAGTGYNWHTDDTVTKIPLRIPQQPAIPEAGGIGDVSSTAKGSGARYNEGKPDFSLIPLVTLEEEARVWMYGAKKYAAHNWMKGMPWSVPLACALRHIAAWQAGEDIDSESGQTHLAHAMCNLRMLMLYTNTYPEGDDRPPKELMP